MPSPGESLLPHFIVLIVVQPKVLAWTQSGPLLLIWVCPLQRPRRTLHLVEFSPWENIALSTGCKYSMHVQLRLRLSREWSTQSKIEQEHVMT